MNKGAVVGRCYVCREPVHTRTAQYISDPTVINSTTGRNVRRVVHRGECADRVGQLFVGKGDGLIGV
jgi:hypothetical protein